MKSINAAMTLLMTIVIISPAHAQLLIDEAREAKTKTDRILNQLQIPTTVVDVYFPRSYVKAALDQMVIDLPKIETKVADLQNAQTNTAFIELSMQTNSGAKLFKSCQNRITTSVKKDGQDLPHNLVLIPAERGQVVRQNNEWLVEVNGTGAVTLGIEIPDSSTLLSATSFEVVQQPLPAANVGTLTSGTVPAIELRFQNGLTLKTPAEVQASCATFIPYSIASYKMGVFGRTGNNTINVTGASFSAVRALLQARRAGDQVTFTQITLRHQDLSQPILTSNLAFELR